MVGAETPAIGPQPRTNQKEGGADGSQNIGQQRAGQEEEDIGRRRRLSFDGEVDATGDDIDRSDDRDEGQVITAHPGDGERGGRRKEQEIIACRDRAQDEGCFAVMFFPPGTEEQRADGHGGQKQPEGQNHPWIGLVSHMLKLSTSLVPSPTIGHRQPRFPPKEPFKNKFPYLGAIQTGSKRHPGGVTLKAIENWELQICHW